MSHDLAVKSASAEAPELSLNDIREAAARIAGAVVRTPTMHSITLSEITGADIWSPMVGGLESLWCALAGNP